MPLGSRCERLQFMMRCTQGLTIVEVEQCTTILQLNDVVGVHAVLRLCPSAPMAMVVSVLAPTTSTCHHLGTPCPELWGGVHRILDLGW